MSARFLTLSGSVAALVSLCAATPARAQDTSAGLAVAVPRVEFGANAGGLLAGGEGLFTPGVRVGVALNRRFAIESGFDSLEFDRSSYGNSWTSMYFAHVKQTIRAGTERMPSIFATYGGAGILYHSHFNGQTFNTSDGRVYTSPERSNTDVSRPFIASAGIGMQQVIAKYAAVRVEAQLMVVPEYLGAGASAFGGRVSAGVSVPIGGYRR